MRRLRDAHLPVPAVDSQGTQSVTEDEGLTSLSPDSCGTAVGCCFLLLLLLVYIGDTDLVPLHLEWIKALSLPFLHC